MDAKAIWFFCFVGMMLVAGGIGGFLAYKKVKYLNFYAATLAGVTLYLGFELLFYLDQPQDVNIYFRYLLSPVLGIVGFCGFLFFMNILRPTVRRSIGLEDDPKEHKR